MATRKPSAAETQPAGPARASNPAGLTPARVLAACSLGSSNDVVELDAETLAAALAAGLVDAHPDAVAAATLLS